MNIEVLKQNIRHIKEITREINVFTTQLGIISELEKEGKTLVNLKEKQLLFQAIESLTNQIKILNKSIPQLVDERLSSPQSGNGGQVAGNLVQIKYSPTPNGEKISLVISQEDKKSFLENLSKSHLSVNQLKKSYSTEKRLPEFGKPNLYAKLSNHFFRQLSTSFINKGKFKRLNEDLRKMNSPFVISTYVSMMFFSSLIAFFLGIIIYVLLWFFDFSLTFPFLFVGEGDILTRMIKYIWIVVAIPLSMGVMFYFYPSSERKGLGNRINQELPFVTIHMSAVATSGVEPISIFEILLKSKEYRYTNMVLRKLMNLINFHGLDMVTALKRTAKSSPSDKLKELLEGLATSITSGGNLHSFLDKHAESLLFDYKIDREKYTKASETFMDIYISVVIAAPMIFLMLFIIMGSTGSISGFMGMTTELVSFLIIAGIVGLNIGFLIFLQVKQPAI